MSERGFLSVIAPGCTKNENLGQRLDAIDRNDEMERLESFRKFTKAINR